MAGSFKVGEIVILHSVPDRYNAPNGAECEIIGPYETYPVMFGLATVTGYIIAVGHKQIAVQERFLKRKPPKEDANDRNAVVEWKDCAWRPEQVPA